MPPAPRDKVIGSYLSGTTFPDTSGPHMAEVPREFKAQLYRNQVRSFSTLTATPWPHMLTTPYPVPWDDVSLWQRHSMSRSILVLLQTGDAPHLHQDQLSCPPHSGCQAEPASFPSSGPAVSG